MHFRHPGQHCYTSLVKGAAQNGDFCAAATWAAMLSPPLGAVGDVVEICTAQEKWMLKMEAVSWQHSNFTKQESNL